ncbi:glycerophosphodiester phosphodiesterase [Serinicoccus sp. CNJ-927]|uniref:ABC-F family ATP-binding cassette domain-containing protein n=1 Tax=unclassified Serinicoccus TaxID=2643101 RepID=UPI0009607C54|nr:MULTISPECIES: ABC-F family ATP-binding cassette domain-containing protein [unclassified Serinicoccus]OLT18799.1 glycerophosphodiester phosphodiesterase [Serinicoccus sp. CUA-874]OLT43381.1 glycerophosphodiester phosphodiesterase [Serinicoccus sp. CNJ-927]
MAGRPPASLVTLADAHLLAGTQVLLDEVSVGVLDGDRIGVVGRNGGGKTSLLSVLTGDRPLDAGRVIRTGDVTVGMLSQTDVLDPDAAVRQVVLGDLDEHEWAGDARVRHVIDGLLGDSAGAVGGWEASVGPLSGGERRRLALAALLVADPDLLVLDEPTNHLDVEGVAWLAAYLSGRRPRPGGALVVVTHDRWFLDAVSTLTWEVADGEVHTYEGGYAAYVLAKVERQRVARVTQERRENLARKELAWLRRGAPARTSKPKFRIEAATELIQGEPPPRDSVELVRFATTRLGKDVLDLLDATVRVGERDLLTDVTWRIGPGDRYGVVGVNGAGKSTLLRVLLGQHPLAAGKLKTGKTVRMACLSQELRELDRVAGWSVIDAITEVRSFTVIGGKEVSASSLAKRLGFSGGRQQSRVGDLSGGERRRLQFVRLLMDEPNVLLLDEPTNDLDIDTLTAMEDVLDGWAGTLLVVSHDRYLLERMTDRQVALLGDGSLRDLPGGVEEYLRLREGMSSAGRTRGSAASPSGTPTAARVGGPAAGGSGSGSSSRSPAQVREARKTLARVEKALDRLHTQQQRLHEQMAAVATDPDELARLTARDAELTAQEEALETEWLEASEVAEA